MGDRRVNLLSGLNPVKAQVVTTDDALQCFVHSETQDEAEKKSRKKDMKTITKEFKTSVTKKSIYDQQQDNWSVSETTVTNATSSTSRAYPNKPKEEPVPSPQPAEISMLPPSAAPAKTKRQLTRAVPLDWYFRYVNVLPKEERMILQPPNELLPDEREMVLKSQRKQMGCKSSIYLHIMNTPGMPGMGIVSAPKPSKTVFPRGSDNQGTDVIKLQSSKSKKGAEEAKKVNLYDIQLVNRNFGKTMVPVERKKLKRFFVRKLRLKMIAKVQRSRNEKSSHWIKMRDRKVYVFSKLFKMKRENEARRLLASWMTLVTTVKSMVQFGAAIKEIARSTETVQAEIEIFMNKLLEEQQKRGGVHFDPKYFGVDSRKLSQQSIYNLTMPSVYRTHKDIRKTVEELLFVRSFSRFPKELQYLFAKMGWYHETARHRVIVRQGQRPQMFYFIISGRTIVVRLVGSPNLHEASGFQFEKNLYAGQSFGYQKLFDIGMDYRYTTVTSLEKTTMVGIDIDDFLYYMSQRGLSAERRFKHYHVPPYISFLMSMELFHDFDEEFMCTEFKKNRNVIPFYFEPGACITKKTADSHYVFVVRTGRVHVLLKTLVLEPKRHSATLTFFRPPKNYEPVDTDGSNADKADPASRHLSNEADTTTNCITDEYVFIEDELDCQTPTVYLEERKNSNIKSEDQPSQKLKNQEITMKSANDKVYFANDDNKLPRIGTKRPISDKNYSSNISISSKQRKSPSLKANSDFCIGTSQSNNCTSASKLGNKNSKTTANAKPSSASKVLAQSNISAATSASNKRLHSARGSIVPDTSASLVKQSRRSSNHRGSVHFNKDTVFTESNKLKTDSDDLSVSQDSIEEELQRIRNTQGKWESEADRMVESINASSSWGLLTLQMASSVEKMVAVPNAGSLKRYCWVHLGDSWPRDALGLEDMDFGDDLGSKQSTHAAIISDGAECLCIKKSFIRGGSTAKFRAQVRSMGFSWPRHEQIHAKLRAGTDWATYKTNLRRNADKPYVPVPMDEEGSSVKRAEMDRKATHSDGRLDGVPKQFFKVVTGRTQKETDSMAGGRGKPSTGAGSSQRRQSGL